MQDIQDFIKQASGSLGIGEDSAGATAGGLLHLIKGQAAKADGDALVNAIPGAAQLMARTPQAAASSAGGGDLLGGIMSKAGGLLGGKAGSALSVMGLFKQSGLSGDQAGSFASLFFDFARSKAGSDLVGRILGQIPELKKLLG